MALAKVKKTGAISSTGASIGGNDDEITFNLNLEVLGTSPDATFTPEDLAGTPIRLDSADATRILVSDVVPEGTVLKEAPIAPAGGNWKVVYSTSDPTTTIPVKSSAAGALAAAEWTTTEPTSPAGFAAVKRVGFIYEPGGTGSDTAKITKGSPLISGFSFKVVTSGLQPIGGNVYNMGQVFGTTNGGNGEIVYDESGDNNANNFNDNGTPPDDTGTNFDPANNNGIPDPDLNNDGTEDNVDTAGNNTGTGTEGEVLKIVVVGTVLATDDILNGPAGQAGAVGPNNDNDDYTNATTAVPAGFQEGTNITTAQTQTITNTVGVKTGVPRIDNITLEPIAPSLAAAKGGGNYYGANTDIPDETLVTITYGAKTATYIYDQTNGEFDLQSGTPVNIGTLLGGQTANYTVQITIPANTVDPLTAVSVPIIAFPDDGNRETDNTDSTAVDSKGADGIAGTADDPTGVAYTGESVNNITIDRLYTGFMKLVKEARILNTDGTVKSGWTTNPTAKAAPGEFIEYRITYTNISQTPQGTGNVSLTAKNFSLIEDGNAAFSGVKTAGPDGIPGNGDDVTIADGSGDDNNWAANTTHQQSTVVGGIGSSTTVDYYKGASKIGSSDPSNGTAVDKYINTVPSISPGISGTFKFRRMVNLGPTP